MPELPEVEITRRGIAPFIEGRTVTSVTVRERRLRWPVSRSLARTLVGQTARAIGRRGKYLLVEFATGCLIVHLGMSGSLRLVAPHAKPGRHEHIDIAFGGHVLRLRDPRRFGAVLWTEGNPASHPLIARLGVEPLSAAFTPEYLLRAVRGRRTPVKQLLMNNAIVVGIGNIYASESLFRAGIAPTSRAGHLTPAACRAIVLSVQDTLEAALAAGGSTLRDFVRSDGGPGWFQQQHYVYGRAGEPCRVCGSTIRCLRQGQRSSFYCPRCQSSKRLRRPADTPAQR